MRIHIIGCRVLTRELSALIYQSSNIIDVTWIPQGMQDTPVLLHKRIESCLEQLYQDLEKTPNMTTPDYIVLGYGLCSKATEGIRAKKIPIVIPATEDCIGIFLGSQERYLDCFRKYPGTFWANSRWAEELPEFQPDYEEKLHQKYMEQYDDEDTADYLVEMAREGLKNYHMLGYIGTDTFDDSSQKALSKGYADRYQLSFREFSGDRTILQKIADGKFDPETFCILNPGEESVLQTDQEPQRLTARPYA
jgi:hypothetical protein